MRHLLILLCFPLSAATITVCASGCDYTSAYAAVRAANSGDIVELKAGEVFNEIDFGRKHNILLRSSRWRELPPPGTRVDPVTHAHLMPTIRATGTTLAVRIGSYEVTMKENGVNTTNDTITFEYTPETTRFTDGDAIVCIARGYNPVYTLPTPLVDGPRRGDGGVGQIYYVRDSSVTSGEVTAKLSLTRGGTAIDITAAGTGSVSSYYYNRPSCSLLFAPTGITLQGVIVDGIAGTNNLGWLQIGGASETNPATYGPSGIVLDRIIINYARSQDGPGQCLAISSGSRIVVRDSWIGGCKKLEEEGKAITVNGVEGNGTPGSGLWVKNTYISGASIVMLTAGNGSATNKPNEDLLVEESFFEKPGWMMYKQGAGAPSGACYYGGAYGQDKGAFYRNTTPSPNTCANGACYTCQSDNTWALDTGATYRTSHYKEKNIIELKDCKRCTFRRNMMRGGYAGPDSGQGFCFGGAAIVGNGASTYHVVHDTIFESNWADHCWGGVFATQAAYESLSHVDTAFKNYRITNNVFTNMGRYPMLSSHASAETVYRNGWKSGSQFDGMLFAHNTIRLNTDAEVYTMFTVDDSGTPRFRNAVWRDNILPSAPLYTIVGTGVTMTCTAPGGLLDWFTSGFTHFRNNIYHSGATSFQLLSSPCTTTITSDQAAVAGDANIGFTSSSDPRLTASSNYSAANGSATLLASDGASLGADVDEVYQWSRHAEAGTSPIVPQFSMGSTSGVIEFPFHSTTCTVEIFTNFARTTRHADASSAQACSRTGSVVVGATVRYVLGTVSALTAGTTYYYRITSGTHVLVGSFATRSAAAGSLAMTFDYASSRTGNVCTDAAMSTSCSAISSVSTHTVSVPQGAVRYYQAAGGTVIPLVAP